MDIGTAKLPPPSGGASRTTCSTLSTTRETATRRGVPGMAPVVDRRAARPAASCPSWSAARRSTPAPCSTGSSSPAPTTDVRRAARGRSCAEVRRPLHARLREVDPEAAARILPEQRPPDRPRARGGRAHRAAVHRVAAAAGVRRPAHRPGRGRHRPAHARRADRAAGGPDVRRTASSTRSTRLLARGLAGDADGAAGDRLPRGGGPPRRRAGPGRGAGADDGGHPPVRPAPGLVVPQGPADHLGRATTTRTGLDRAVAVRSADTRVDERPEQDRSGAAGPRRARMRPMERT